MTSEHVKQYKAIKEQYPDALLILNDHSSKCYRILFEDAKNARRILVKVNLLHLIKMGEGESELTFAYNALDTILTNLVRATVQVCVADAAAHKPALKRKEAL